MQTTPNEFLEFTRQELDDFIQRMVTRQARDADFDTTAIMAESYFYVMEQIRLQRVSLRRLRQMLFGARTEKTATVLGTATSAASPSPAESASSEPATPDPPSADTSSSAPPSGHGRHAADAYGGAERVTVPHPSLHAGDPCPECQRGTLYRTSRPKVLLRFTGHAPLQAHVYELERLRCNLCGKLFIAPTPAGAGTQKYAATTGSMIGLLKYGSGFPFNRLARLQGMCDIPLSASTQWDVIDRMLPQLEPAHHELIRQAAQGDVVYNDDTKVRILELMGKRAARRAAAAPPSTEDSADAKKKKRTGLFTSGIISTREGRRIALFFSGRQHAGENLHDVLIQRAENRESPIQMCDALSRNLPQDLRTIVAHCLAHSRRKFVDVFAEFSDECRYVLEMLRVVYHNDAEAKQRQLPAEERLCFHQARSGPVMQDLEQWLRRQFDERLVEPNSSLGEAITYMLNHWDPLTLFLHRAGAPLDNNVVERALKKAILHRKGSLFFRSEHGAHAGDVFMSLIYTCELCGANAFDYLTELQRHAAELAAHPQDWMPWNYRDTLAAMSDVSPAVATH